jgi:hypothetical protein
VAATPVDHIVRSLAPGGRVRVVVNDCDAPGDENVVADRDAFAYDQVAIDEGAASNDQGCIRTVEGNGPFDNGELP